MAQKTDQFLKERYICKVRQFPGLSEFNCLFDDLAVEQQAALSSHIDESLMGVPVLFFTKPGGEWTLLCTRQVVGFDGKTYCAVLLSDIEGFYPAELIGLDGKESLRKVREGGKKEFNQLSVRIRNRAPIILHANKGADFHEMCGVLLMAARLNNWAGGAL
ncbi:hypothetical protein [Chitinophaga pinensis]|uniref:Uncharacterized protein n=1 Tax=Chitinophaga pinensis (strain ATCC 43595 / DSM 2588 / LMG 13176 / NBRC 15968 / NCIMB 11800 / UQM 2034) TaxID=485918 RepID=A0A979G496_CHIPD|nr:hypothetical protein [Chitinophaga pinensis]ACU60504.1 hypothetical protein Cpin_3028 [Chitinophaga pinensis DSM 2588]